MGFFVERTLAAGSSFTSGLAPETVGLGDGVTREEIEAVSTSLLSSLLNSRNFLRILGAKRAKVRRARNVSRA